MRMTNSSDDKWASFWEGLSVVVVILGIILYIVFLAIGKPKDCSPDGFTFNSVTVRTTNHAD